MRLALFILAYTLGNFLRRLCLPKAVKHWSSRSVQIKLIKIGGRLVRPPGGWCSSEGSSVSPSNSTLPEVQAARQPP